jgi:hypothetical protein
MRMAAAGQVTIRQRLPPDWAAGGGPGVIEGPADLRDGIEAVENRILSTPVLI